MSYWIELHCDAQVSGSRCANYNHDYSMQGCGNTIGVITKCIKRIHIDASKMGWKFKDKKWFCKNCWNSCFSS